jgi:hypothetical protein
LRYDAVWRNTKIMATVDILQCTFYIQSVVLNARTNRSINSNHVIES